jgi:5-bromo-4-chloroindolyl phosphate hydrolysis protein
MEVTKGSVRSNFSYARELMRKAEWIMKNSKSVQEWEESSEAGQIALELIASVATFSQWVEEQGQKK